MQMAHYVFINNDVGKIAGIFPIPGTIKTNTDGLKYFMCQSIEDEGYYLIMNVFRDLGNSQSEIIEIRIPHQSVMYICTFGNDKLIEGFRV